MLYVCSVSEVQSFVWPRNTLVVGFRSRILYYGSLQRPVRITFIVLGVTNELSNSTRGDEYVCGLMCEKNS